MSRTHTVVASPIGPLTVIREDGALVRLAMSPPGHLEDTELGERSDDGFTDVTRQLGEYFAGERTEFDLPLPPRRRASSCGVGTAARGSRTARRSTYGSGAATLGDGAARRRSAPPTAATRWRSSSPATGWSAPTASWRATPAGWTGSGSCSTWSRREQPEAF